MNPTQHVVSEAIEELEGLIIFRSLDELTSLIHSAIPPRTLLFAFFTLKHILLFFGYSGASLRMTSLISRSQSESLSSLRTSIQTSLRHPPTSLSIRLTNDLVYVFRLALNAPSSSNKTQLTQIVLHWLSLSRWKSSQDCLLENRIIIAKDLMLVEGDLAIFPIGREYSSLEKGHKEGERVP